MLQLQQTNNVSHHNYSLLPQKTNEFNMDKWSADFYKINFNWMKTCGQNIFDDLLVKFAESCYFINFLF